MDPEQEFREGFLKRFMQWHFVSPVVASEFADYALAQAKLESAGFTSNVCLSDNNCIGYKSYPGSVWQKGAGIISPEGDGYAVYDSIADCAGELADYIHRHWSSDFSGVESVDDYAHAMIARGYAGTSFSNYDLGLDTYYVSSPVDGLSTSVPDTLSKAVGFVGTSISEYFYYLIFVFAVMLVFVPKAFKKLRL